MKFSVETSSTRFILGAALSLLVLVSVCRTNAFGAETNEPAIIATLTPELKADIIDYTQAWVNDDYSKLHSYMARGFEWQSANRAKLTKLLKGQKKFSVYFVKKPVKITEISLASLPDKLLYSIVFFSASDIPKSPDHKKLTGTVKIAVVKLNISSAHRNPYYQIWVEKPKNGWKCIALPLDLDHSLMNDTAKDLELTNRY